MSQRPRTIHSAVFGGVAALLFAASQGVASPAEERRRCSVAIGVSSFVIDQCTVRTLPDKIEFNWAGVGDRIYRGEFALGSDDTAQARWNGYAAGSMIDQTLGEVTRDGEYWNGNDPKVRICFYPDTNAHIIGSNRYDVGGEYEEEEYEYRAPGTDSGWANRLSGGSSVAGGFSCWASQLELATSTGRMLINSSTSARLEGRKEQQWTFAQGGNTGVAVNGSSFQPLYVNKDEGVSVVRVSDAMSVPRITPQHNIQSDEAQVLQALTQMMMGHAVSGLGLDQRAFVVNWAERSVQVVTFDQGQDLYDHTPLTCF